MRLISQDGKGDMAYEGFVFGCHGGTIVATRDILGSPKSVIAQYSSEEKAMKVMQLIQNQYLDFCCNYHAQSGVFRFPKDEEVEV